MKGSTRRVLFAATSAVAITALCASTATAQSKRQPPANDGGSIAGTGIPQLSTIRVASSNPPGNPLVRPIFCTFAPGDPTRLFIIEKQGHIRILKLDTNPPTLLPTPFLDIDSVITGGTSQASEQGLLGLAFHPNYQQNGMFWVYYTAQSPLGNDTLARFHVSANPDIAEGSNTTGTVLISLADAESNHNAGWLSFRPGDTQGYLYMTIGDGGGGCDQHSSAACPNGNGQCLATLFGKMLRIDIDGADGIPGNDDDDGVLGNSSTGGYTSPSTNPFFSTPGAMHEIWDYGLRNPWRPSFDRGTGDLYIADVGQDAFEEVNYEPVSSPGGNNYGWRCMEGTQPSTVSACSTVNCPTTSCGGSLVCPIHTYAHDGTVCSITGGYVYRGATIVPLQGTYFFADYNCSIPGPAPIWSFKVVGGAPTNFTSRTTELAPGGGLVIDTLTSFGEDYFGEMYICDQEGGEIFKIVTAPCLADIVPNGNRDVNDLLQVISHWGPCPAPCPADVFPSGTVDVNDLLTVTSNWGPCP